MGNILTSETFATKTFNKFKNCDPQEFNDISLDLFNNNNNNWKQQKNLNKRTPSKMLSKRTPFGKTCRSNVYLKQIICIHTRFKKYV